MVLPFMTIYLNEQLQIPLGDCAIIMAFFGMGSVCGSFLGGILTDKIGFYRVMYTSLLLSSICFVLLMKMVTFTSLCFGIFVLALIYEVFRPANLTAIEAYSKKENLTRSLGLVRLAVNLGYACGPMMGGIVAFSLGYEYLFVFNGLALFLGGSVFYILFKNKKHRTTSKELSNNEQKKLLMPWQDLRYLSYLAFFTISIIVFMQFLYTVPIFMKTEYKLDEVTVGMFLAMNGLLIAIVEMPLLFYLEIIARPVIYVVIGTCLFGLGFFMFNCIATPLIAAILFCLFLTFGEMLSFPFSNNYALSFSNDHNRGKYMGLYTMTFSFAHVVGPYLGLTVAEKLGYNYLWAGSLLICLIAAFLIFITRNAQVPEHKLS